MPLGDLGEWLGGGTPSKREPRFWNGNIPWVSPKDMKRTRITDSSDHITQEAIEASPVTLVPPGAVLIVTRSGILAHTLPVAVTDAAVTVNQDMRALVPSRGVYVDYVAAALRAHAHAILDSCSKDGTTVHSVDSPKLAAFRVPIAPSEEQRRIVSALDSYLSRLDEAETALERVARNLMRYRASILQAAVEGRLVPTEAELAQAEGRDYEPASELLRRILAKRRRCWEEAELARLKAAGKRPGDDRWKAKYQEPRSLDATTLPPLPDGWCWATLPQLGELNRGKSKHRPRNDVRLLGGAYPFIQTADVRKADGYVESYSATYSEFGLQQSRLWPAGTLCITIAANIAETGILRFPACFPDSVVGFVNLGEPALTRFVEIFLRTARTTLERYAPATAQKNINLETLAELAVPLPPVGERERIMAEFDERLSVARSNDAAVGHALNRLRRLRQAILEWAFEGRLVDQDPNDEPASVLLERIRAERAQATVRDLRRPRRHDSGGKHQRAPGS